MGAGKYYAVRKGRTRGLFATWEECRACVEGYPDAEYKSFRERREAEGYLEGVPRDANSGGVSAGDGASERPAEARDPGSGSFAYRAAQSERPAEARDVESDLRAYRAMPEECPGPDTLLAYVDGSYDDSLKKYAFGCVFILPDGRVCTEFGNGEKEQALKHRNVSGEMLGAMYAVKTAMASDFRQVELRYDYEGIEKWVTGKWRSKTELTEKYAKAMREWGTKIDIRFTKVAAHSNVYYNELADKLAKKGLREGQGTPKIKGLGDGSEIS